MSATRNTSGVAYDAAPLLGLGAPHSEPLPTAKDGEIVIYYGGWSLRELSDSPVVRVFNLMREQDWYHKYPWADEKLPAGIYRLRVPVPNSNRQTFAEQECSLPSGEQSAPVVLVATALLAHHVQTGEDLLKTEYTRCKEQTPYDLRVELCWLDGRLRVYDNWDSDRYDHVWLSSVLTF